MSKTYTHLLVLAVLFFVVSNPMTYKLTDKILSPIVGRISQGCCGCPTTIGLLVHAVVFALVAHKLHH
jgi:hypothetical protein